MSETKTLVIDKKANLAKISLTLAKFAALLAVATIAPLFHNQPITGPIVNATLFLGVIFLGTQNALLVGLIPSVIALSSGLLPSPLAPMVPFIMLGNAVLIITFGWLKQKNFWLAVGASSILKFLFLFSTSFVVINLIAQKPIAQKASQMMAWPQLTTALAGGLLAYLILKIFVVMDKGK